MHEYLAEAIIGKEYIPAGARPATSRASALALRTLAGLADGVVVAYDGMLRQFAPRPRLRWSSPNYPRFADFEDAGPIADMAADRRFRLAYIGGLSRHARLRPHARRHGSARRRRRLARAGRRLRGHRTCSARPWPGSTAASSDRVRFLGRVPRDQVPRYLASADVVWNPMLPSVQYSLPSVETKVYEGAAAGLAVLTSDLPDRASWSKAKASALP